MRPPWLLPIGAAAMTLAFVTAGILVLISFLRPDGSEATPPQGPGNREEDDAIARRRAELRAEIGNGARSLRGGMFDGAEKTLRQAKRDSDENPILLSAREKRQLSLLHRQADLLANLLDIDLAEIVQLARGKAPSEWAAQFKKNYYDEAVIFDDRIELDGQGRFRLKHYRLFVGESNEPIRVDLQLDVLKGVPLSTSRRMIVGARLKSVHRDKNGEWVVQFEPESGVLMTDEATTTQCGWITADDGELLDVLQWQRRYLGVDAGN